MVSEEEKAKAGRRQSEWLRTLLIKLGGGYIFSPALLPPDEAEAKIPAKPKRTPPRPVEPPADRWDEFKPMVARAARQTGDNNRLFCKLLDDLEVPVPRRWRLRWKVRTWKAAFNKRGANGKLCLQASIRRFKSRHKS